MKHRSGLSISASHSARLRARAACPSRVTACRSQMRSTNGSCASDRRSRSPSAAASSGVPGSYLWNMASDARSNASNSAQASSRSASGDGGTGTSPTDPPSAALSRMR